MIPSAPLRVQRVTDVSHGGRFSDVSNTGNWFAGRFGLDVKARREFDDGTPVGRARGNMTSSTAKSFCGTAAGGYAEGCSARRTVA